MKLIIDFDSFIYRACFACEDMVEIKPRVYVQAYSLDKGFEYFKNIMDAMLKATACDNYIICLSDWRNFRKEVVPTYKSNRKTKAPPFFDELKKMVYDRFECISKPYLEADDLCRALYEDNPRDSIIASIDKDLQSFPCKLFNPDHVEWGVRRIDERKAFENFAKQLIMGDKTDGYEGIKGMGESRTTRLLPKLKSIDDIVAYYIENGYTEDDFRQIYNQAKILGKREIGELRLELYGGELWTIPKQEM